MSTFKPSWIFSPSPSLRNLSLFWKVFTRSYRLVIITLEKQKHWFELITQALDELIFGKKKINIKIRGIGWRQTWGNDVVQSHTSFKGQTVLGFPANENYREFFFYAKYRIISQRWILRKEAKTMMNFVKKGKNMRQFHRKIVTFFLRNKRFSHFAGNPTQYTIHIFL